MKEIDNLLRDNIKSLTPYSSARDEYQGDEAILLDANENPFNTPYSRYPDPLQHQLKEKISSIKQVPADQIFLGNGSDEPIDLIIRIFCEPRIDNIVAIEPTYGMYKVAADINNVEYRKVLLSENFQLIASKLLSAVDKNTKLIFLCSPNNPTGNCLDESEIVKVLNSFAGIVILDEAYMDFSGKKGFLERLTEFPRLVVLQTFSKAWGLASIRLGMAFASKQIIDALSKIKYPYNINILTQQNAIDALENVEKKNDWINMIITNKTILISELEDCRVIRKIYPSDANFFLIKVDEPKMVYDYLVENKIIVRNRSNISLCAGCLRITVGTQEENNTLTKVLKKY